LFNGVPKTNTQDEYPLNKMEKRSPAGSKTLLHFFTSSSLIQFFIFVAFSKEIGTDSKKEKLNFIIEFYN